MTGWVGFSSWPEIEGLRQVGGGVNTESQSLDQMVSDEALALQFCRKKIPTKRGSRETVFIRRRKSTVPFGLYTSGLRESRAVVVLVAFVGHLFLVSFGQSSCFAWF